MNPFLLVIILQYNTCNCKLTKDGVDYLFKSDTMQVVLTEGTARLILSCANGWWVRVNMNHDGKKRRIEYLPIDTRNQKPCKSTVTPLGIIPRRL